MQFGQPPSNPKNPNSPDSFKILRQNEEPPQFTLEYYKNKQNGIERNLDDVLQSLLPNLVNMDNERYKSASKAYLQPGYPAYDALDIKGMLQSAYRPDPSLLKTMKPIKKKLEIQFLMMG